MPLIPAHYLDAVAVIEDAHMENDQQAFVPVATGTVLGYVQNPGEATPVEEEIRSELFLVTNRHVIDGKTDLWIRFNRGPGSRRFRIAVKEDGEELFSVSSRFDLAVTRIDGQALREAGAEFDFIPHRAFLDLAALESAGVAGGDGVFVLGFPMRIAGKEKKYAVVRAGVVARLDREIVDNTDGFLIDCPVFPGNSGGPVILRPEMVPLGGEAPRTRVHLMGIVSGYLPYIDTAISEQTLRPRVSFEENSGLATVIPMDGVDELVSPFMEALRAKEQDADASTDGDTGAEDQGAEPEPEDEAAS